MSSTSVANVDALSQVVADHIQALDQASAATVPPAVRPRPRRTARSEQTARSEARQVHRRPGRWLARLAAYLG